MDFIPKTGENLPSHSLSASLPSSPACHCCFTPVPGAGKVAEPFLPTLAVLHQEWSYLGMGTPTTSQQKNSSPLPAPSLLGAGIEKGTPPASSHPCPSPLLLSLSPAPFNSAGAETALVLPPPPAQ